MANEIPSEPIHYAWQGQKVIEVCHKIGSGSVEMIRSYVKVMT